MAHLLVFGQVLFLPGRAGCVLTMPARNSTIGDIPQAPQIRRFMLDHYAQLLGSLGFSPDSSSRSTAQDSDEGQDAFVPFRDFAQLLEDAAVQLDDPCVGLRIGLETHPRELGVLGYVLLNSPTVRAAADNFVRYMGLHQTGVELKTSQDGERWRLSYRVPDPSLWGLYQDAESTIGIIVAGIEALTEQRFSPVEIHLRRKTPANAEEYRQLLSRARVRFGQPVDAVLVDLDVMETSVASADDHLLSVLDEHARILVARAPSEDELGGRLEEAVARSLHSGQLRITHVARTLGMSERTLRRRLSDRQTSFHDVADQVRERLARERLATGDLSLTEIAFLLGYSELSAFGRAFRRWTGETPRAYRERASLLAR